jgi:hypothetical protein
MPNSLNSAIISKLREAFAGKGALPDDKELRLLCCVSSCEKLRNEICAADYDLILRMLHHNNCYVANLGRALLRPFIEKFGKSKELLPSLLCLWGATQNDNLKVGLLFEIFLYKEIKHSTEFVNKAFEYLEENKCTFSEMLEEWFEGKDGIIENIEKRLASHKDNPLQTALWLFSLVSVAYSLPQQVEEIFRRYSSCRYPIIQRIIKFIRQKMEECHKKDVHMEEMNQNWLISLEELKKSLNAGAKSTFLNYQSVEKNVDGKITEEKVMKDPRVFINIRNRHLSYPKGDEPKKEIPPLQWRYAGLSIEDFVSGENALKETLRVCLSVELFGGMFMSSSFKIEDYLKVVKLKDYFKTTADIVDFDKGKEGILTKFLDEFKSAVTSEFGAKHPRSDIEEKYLRQILNYKLNKYFPEIGSNNKDRWEKIVKLIERRYLFTEHEVKNAVVIMLGLTFGAYYPIDIFVVLCPKRGKKVQLIQMINNAIERFKDRNSSFDDVKTITLWNLPPARTNHETKSRMALILLERTFSHIVFQLLAKIYSLYFNYFISKGRDQVIIHGLSAMLAAPIDVDVEKSIKLRGGEEKIDEILVDLDDTWALSIPYPVHMESDAKSFNKYVTTQQDYFTYKEITRYKVRTLLTKLEEYYNDILNEQKKLRMKDAVVAIMGRNMSHNIGSHVLWHLGENLTKDSSNIGKIKQFYTYLRERMGYIALIATERPCWGVDRSLQGTVDYFANMELLLNNIVLTEKVIDKGCEYRFNPIVKKENENTLRAVFESPHGSYGEHAFYVILENIIRNTIKHNRDKLSRVESENYISFYISADEPSNPKWKADYLEIGIRDNLNEYSVDLEELKEDLQKKADEDIFNEFGERNRRNLGFKEKRICAAFLRMIPQEGIDSEELKKKISVGEIPPLLKIDKKDDHLVHTIYLRKPKKALIITDNEKLLNHQTHQVAEEKGIFIINKEGVQQLLHSGSIEHKFLILDLKDASWLNESIREEYYVKLPCRILSTTPLSFNRRWRQIPLIDREVITSNISNPDSLYTLFWELWVKGFFQASKSKMVFVVDEGASFASCSPNLIIDKSHTQYNSSHIVFSHQKIERSHFNDAFACEVYSGEVDGAGKSIKMLLSDKSFSYLYHQQLSEPFFWKIAVIDERIFAKREIGRPHDKFEFKPTVKQLWEKRGVRIIDPEEFINGNWSGIGEPDFLVIHQGVIDKYKNAHKDKNDFIKRWENEIKNKVPFLVIDSDRGKPDGVEKLGAMWIQFSDLGDIMVHKSEDSLAKYLLIEILTSLRGEVYEGGNSRET